MARQKGHVKYTGTLGDVRHFKIKGQQGYFAICTKCFDGFQKKQSCHQEDGKSSFG